MRPKSSALLTATPECLGQDGRAAAIPVRLLQEGRIMLRTITVLCLSFGLAMPALAAEVADYKGPFPTTVLYDMCSKNDQASREKCALYLQGLVYGIRIQRQMTEKGMAVCLPEIAPEQARARVMGLIEQATGGRPETNKDGGDWIAAMALMSGNLCDKPKRR
jgi:hypothetical protein